MADDETSLLRDLMTGWGELPGPITVARAMELVDAASDDQFTNLRMVIRELPRGRDRNAAIGNLLKQWRGRVLDGRCLVSTGNSTKKWSIKKAA